MAAKVITYEVNGELYNGWGTLITPEPPDRTQQCLKSDNQILSA